MQRFILTSPIKVHDADYRDYVCLPPLHDLPCGEYASADDVVRINTYRAYNYSKNWAYLNEKGKQNTIRFDICVYAENDETAESGRWLCNEIFDRYAYNFTSEIARQQHRINELYDKNVEQSKLTEEQNTAIQELNKHLTLFYRIKRWWKNRRQKCQK